jgi:hypothetical protein
MAHPTPPILRTIWERRGLLAVLLAIIVVVTAGVPAVVSDKRQGDTVNQAQEATIEAVQRAHLLGAHKAAIQGFFREQGKPCMEHYGTLNGDGWEHFSRPGLSANTIGMVISGAGGFVGHTAGMAGPLFCERNWNIETDVLFDNKGRVIGVEVRPIGVGCDI